jgi:membrane protein
LHLLVRVGAGLVRVQIFDRAMTVAAQAFTSIFPVLILLSLILGIRQRGRLASLARLPEESRWILVDALGERGFSAFGAAGTIVVLVSATSLARALARTYAAIWEVPRLPGGLAAAWRWFATALMLPVFLAGTRVLVGLVGELPLSRVSSAAVNLVADCLVAVLLPWLVLSGAVSARLLVPGGCLFGVTMLAVRPAGTVYLPRALEVSADRYGTIGLAFTYIGWLYVLSFCLVAAAVLGREFAEDEGALGRWVRSALRVRT